MRKVAILGGAFDPVHWDHLRLAGECVNFGLAEEVWFTPSPERWDKKPILSAPERLDLLRIALQGRDLFRICQDELEQGSFRGSLVLLRTLRDRYAIDPLLVVGADTYASIPNWRDPLIWNGSNPNGCELLAEFSLIVFPRDGHAMPDPIQHTERWGRSLLSFQGPLRPCLGSISSTEVRLRLACGAARELLPPEVLQQIQSKGLYGVPPT